MGNESSRRFTRRKKGSSSVEKVKRKDSKNRSSNGEDALVNKMKNLGVKGGAEKQSKRAQNEPSKDPKAAENGDKAVRSRKVRSV